MLHPLVSARAPRPHRGAAAAVSIAVHVVLVAVFATAVRTTRSAEDLDRSPPERIARYALFLPPPASGAAPAVIPGARAARRSTRRTPPPDEPRPAPRPSPLAGLESLASKLPQTPLGIPDVVPHDVTQPDYGAMATAAIDLGAGTGSQGGAGDGAGAGGLSDALGSPFPRPDESGAYSAESVDRTVQAWRANPKPVYPPKLLHRRVEAAYMVRFIVDSTGRVVASSVTFPADAHPLFVDAIRRALLRSRYNPALIAGRPVAQLAEQQFRFEIRERY